MTITAQQQAEIAAGVAAAQSLAPLLGPNGVLAINLATTLLGAVQAATATGSDVTDAQLAALFSADDAAKLADLLAQAQVAKPASSSGGGGPLEPLAAPKG